MAQLPISSEQNTDYVKAMQQATNANRNAPDKELGQADFLRLLTTQLQNQDPNKPMDPTNFVTDLTQMSQLEATNKMNSSMQAMTAGFQSMQVMQSAALIGKNVQAEGDQMSHEEGQVSQIRMELDQPLEDVTIVITDKNGPVRELFQDDLNAGEKIVDWDGKDSSGNPMPSGEYTLTVYGSDEEGELQSIDTIVPSQVRSISLSDEGTMKATLATGERVDLNKIREIS
ncbi:flagellar hook assembly protein FlgD [Thiomicrospira sp. WB1]|jgi:flagellar basal-body rod modification protein FlgD|uniref:flagellar hook assembly protein FlgD n=1 Tax=Thiomicrospira sp. WB1 TaxID=1685380 RepID=UPI000749E480|nr:flagellar hook capping FlgD N-terminal domain-containing protein [Thiomicrospira sp. WB1]KUJ71603.1 flagellar hook capping protein [Thiomicrospira sp. WB1]